MYLNMWPFIFVLEKNLSLVIDKFVNLMKAIWKVLLYMEW